MGILAILQIHPLRYAVRCETYRVGVATLLQITRQSQGREASVEEEVPDTYPHAPHRVQLVLHVVEHVLPALDRRQDNRQSPLVGEDAGSQILVGLG